jgi:uncharacterized membrane protein
VLKSCIEGQIYLTSDPVRATIDLREQTTEQENLMPNLKARKQAEKLHSELMEMMQRVEATLSMYPLDDSTNYADVGQLAHYKDQLQNISDSLHGEGEYAS